MTAITKGVFIVHEGVDGSGKATQAALFRTWLQNQGLSVVSYEFPTYGRDGVADLIRTELRERPDEWNALPWEARALRYTANRLKYRDEIRNHLQQGKVVVCDRYVGSNQAHMGGATQEADEQERRIAFLEQLEYEVFKLPRPDIVLLHTMPTEFRRNNILKREGGQGDAHERSDQYLDRVEQMYIKIQQRNDHWRIIPSDVDGIVQSPEVIHTRVVEQVMRHPAFADIAVV